MRVKIKKLVPNAFTPSYGSDRAACFDLHFAELKKNGAFGTGLAFEVPVGHAMLVFSRSGHGFNHGVRLANCVGVIDSDYRGEVMVKLVQDNHDKGAFFPEIGDRIAQAMIIPVDTVSFLEVQKLSETERGVGGFGSSGS